MKYNRWCRPRCTFRRCTGPAPAWTTGHTKADAWVMEKGMEAEVLDNLVSVPQTKRLYVVLSTLQKKVRHSALMTTHPSGIVNEIRQWKRYIM